MAPFQPLQPWAPAGCLGVALAASASFSHFRPTWDPLNFNLDWSWVLGRFGWKLCRIRAGKINQKNPDKPSKHFFHTMQPTLHRATNPAGGCFEIVDLRFLAMCLACTFHDIWHFWRRERKWNLRLHSASCENYKQDENETTITQYTVLDTA